MHIKTLSLIALSPILLCLCTKQSFNIDETSENITRSLYSVSFQDIEQHIRFATKGSSTEQIITPIIDNENDTLLYIVNHPEGWNVLSTDKRTPMDIAYGTSGTICLEKMSPSFLAWLKKAAMDIKAIKQTRNEYLAFSSEEIEYNLQQWRRREPSRIIDPDLPIEEIIVIDTIEYTEPVNVMNHLVSAHWDQMDPYNLYCPIKTGSLHYDVGCAGVAGGSLLHHFYKKYNYPTSFEGVPMDSVGVNYSLTATDSTLVTARYLGAVYDVMGIHQGVFGTYSYAFPSEVSSFFNYSGYSCIYDEYDAEIVKSSILNEEPVMILAFDDVYGIFDMPAIWEGHYFLIDGYQTRRHVTCRHIYSISPSGEIIPYSEHCYYSYGPPYLAFVKMNWGWWSQWTDGSNDGWFALTSSWVTDNGTYDYGRHMFYNFERVL